MAVGDAERLNYAGLGSWRRFSIRTRLTLRRVGGAWEVFARNRLALLGLALIGIFALMAISHPILIRTVWPSGVYDPVTGFDFKTMHPAPPSSRHLLGTDGLGRDVLSRLLAATTPTFVLGLTAALITAIVGAAMGAISAYFGGMVDAVLTHISDAFLLLPAPIFMVIVGVAFNEFGPVKLGAIYGLIAGLGGTAVVLRSYALTVMAKPYIEAARIAGGGSAHTILRHLLPPMIPLTSMMMLLSVTGAVVADAFVSFFGLTRLYLNWGTIIYTSQAYMGTLGGGIEWHVLLPPSIALSLFSAAFYLIARGLHEVADPRLRV
ncbi:MAG: ABC transporter permease [Anaerolineae bacterium]